MKFRHKFLILVVPLLLVGGFVCIYFYSYVFARTVKGRVEKVERIPLPNTIIQTQTAESPTAAQLFSFAVAIKESSGEIVTASSEDRQWSVVQEGQCAEAKFYPYPPWNLDKSGTYHGARLLRLTDCSQGQ